MAKKQLEKIKEIEKKLLAKELLSLDEETILIEASLSSWWYKLLWESYEKERKSSYLKSRILEIKKAQEISEKRFKGIKLSQEEDILLSLSNKASYAEFCVVLGHRLEKDQILLLKERVKKQVFTQIIRRQTVLLALESTYQEVIFSRLREDLERGVLRIRDEMRSLDEAYRRWANALEISHPSVETVTSIETLDLNQKKWLEFKEKVENLYKDFLKED
jgi:hypothetical protein